MNYKTYIINAADETELGNIILSNKSVYEKLFPCDEECIILDEFNEYDTHQQLIDYYMQCPDQLLSDIRLNAAGEAFLYYAGPEDYALWNLKYKFHLVCPYTPKRYNDSQEPDGYFMFHGMKLTDSPDGNCSAGRYHTDFGIKTILTEQDFCLDGSIYNQNIIS